MAEGDAGRATGAVWTGRLAPLAFFPLAAVAFLPVWEHWSSQLNGTNSWDYILLEWLIAWYPAAIKGGHSLLVTNYLDAPGGVNLMWNTSMPFLSLVASPLSALVGPVHTFTILLTGALGLSSVAMYLLLTRWVHWWPACWIGGLLYGFSSYSVAEASTGQLHLVFMALLPLMVLVLDHLLRDAVPRVPMLGCLLGLLAAAQLLISEELLLIFALLAAGGLLVGAVSQPAHFRSCLKTVSVAAGWAFVVFVAITAYPLAVQFFGPDHLTGPTQSHAQLALFSGDLTALVLPGPNQLIAPAAYSSIAVHFSTNVNEVTEYVGLPLLVFVAAGVWLRRRDPLVEIMAAVSLVSFILTLGPRLIVVNDHTGIIMPYAGLDHFPVVGDLMPSRFAAGMWFGLAVLAALAFSDLVQRIRRSRGTLDDRGPGVGRHVLARVSLSALAPAVAIVLLVPLLPNWPYPEHPADVPVFFTSSADQVISPGSLVLTYPYPLTATANPMLWQADTGMRFRLLGGYVVAPDASGAGTFFADGNVWEYCLLTVYQDGSAPASLCSPGALSQTLAQLGVGTIIADDSSPNAAVADALITNVVGSRPWVGGGISMWTCSSALARPTSGPG
jgi:hypothetical protein